MDEVIRDISTQGLAVFLVGVFIYFAIQFGNIYLEKQRKKNETKQHDDLAGLRQQISKEIHTVLENTMIRTHSCRAYVFEFHNGTVSMGGLPFLKMSCTYEVLDRNAKSEIYDRQDLSMFLYSTFIESLYENNCVVVDVNNRSDVESVIGYETLAKRKIALTIRARIMNKSNRVFGFIGVDYNYPISDEVIQETISIMREISVKIGALLSIDN